MRRSMRAAGVLASVCCDRGAAGANAPWPPFCVKATGSVGALLRARAERRATLTEGER